MNGSGPLDFDVIIRDTDFKKSFDAMERRVFGFTQKADQSISSLESTFANLGRVAAGAFAFNQLSDLPMQIVKVRGEFQQLEIALNTMLGSKTKADKLLGEIVQTAASTPFGLKDLAAGTKQLLAYGSASGEVIGEIRMLGDVASGVSVPINDLIYLYGTLRSQGRAYAVDIRQFAGRGIPIYKELANVLGVGVGEVNALVEAGKVGFPQVEQAFQNMTKSGGMFGGLMEAQSKSLTGLLERFKDSVDVMFNDIGRANEGLAGSIITGATGIVENYEPVLKILTVLAATYGTYKTALIAVSVAQRIVGASTTATLYLEMARGLGTVTTATYANAVALGVQTQAQAALNAVMAVNPYILAATAIVALAGAVWLLSDNTTAAEIAQKSFNQTLEEQKKKKDELTSKTRELTVVVNSETATTFAQIQAYASLQKLYPALLANMTLQEFKLLKTADAQKLLNAAMDQMGVASTTSEFDKANKEVEKLSQKLAGLRKQQSMAGPGSGGLVIPIADTERALEAAKIEAGKFGDQVNQNTKNLWEANTPPEEQIKHYEKLKVSLESQRSGIEKNITGLQKAGVAANDLQIFFANMSLLGLNQQLDQVGGKLLALQGKPNAMFGGNKGHWEKVSSDATENRNALGINQEGSGEWKRLTKEIEEADKHLKVYNKTKEKAEKKVPEKDKPQPFGSIAYYEQISRKADEIIAKTPGSNTAEIARQNKIKIDAEAKADDIRKQSAVKTFDQELEEKKRSFELYQKWIDAYGQESADKQFESLISSSANYVAYLDTEIKKLESLNAFTPLNDKDSANLLNLRSEKTEAIGGPSKVDQYKESLDLARDSAETLTDYIGFLKQAQDSLSSAAPTTDVIEQRRITAEAKLEAEKQRQQLLRDFLLNTEKRLEIENHYADLRNALEERSQGEKTNAYKKALDLINQAEASEMQERKVRIREASQEYKALIKAVEDAGNSSGIFDQINKQKDLVANLLAGEGYSDAYYVEQKKLGNMQKALYLEIAGAVGEIGSALENLDGPLGDIGSALTGIASQANGLVTVWDKNSTSTQKWGAATQAVASLISMVASSAKQRKEAEAQYYDSVIGQQSQYNLLLNEQLGLQAQAGGSVFYTDFAGTLSDGYEKSADALEKYKQSLEALENGRAKTGKKSGVDWGKVGSGAAAGATIGGIAGAGVFSWATAAIGAAGGALVGLIGGMKKKDTFAPLLEKWPDLIDESKEGIDQFNVALAQTLIDNNLIDEATKRNLQSTKEWVQAYKEGQEQIKGVIADLAGALGSDLRDGLVNAFRDGTSAAEAFGSSVSKILGSLLEQMLFSKIMGPAFDKLEAEMAASSDLLKGGDGDWVDDFGRFFAQQDELGKAYFGSLEDAQKEADKYGIKLWQKEGADGKKTDPLSGAIQGMSQETASVLAGQFNALRISGADVASSMRTMLIFQANISRNSDFQKHLVTIDDKLTVIADGTTRSLRGFGF